MFDPAQFEALLVGAWDRVESFSETLTVTYDREYIHSRLQCALKDPKADPRLRSLARTFEEGDPHFPEDMAQRLWIAKPTCLRVDDRRDGLWSTVAVANGSGEWARSDEYSHLLGVVPFGTAFPKALGEFSLTLDPPLVFKRPQHVLHFGRLTHVPHIVGSDVLGGREVVVARLDPPPDYRWLFEDGERRYFMGVDVSSGLVLGTGPGVWPGNIEWTHVVSDVVINAPIADEVFLIPPK